jgi:SAM-dependent methyltransferase
MTQSKIMQAVFPSFSYKDISPSFDLNKLEVYCPNNWARSLVVSKFIEYVMPHLESKSNLKVAVVGGHLNEPEILALQDFGIRFSIDVLGIENGIKFDLNVLNHEPLNRYDLVVCSQVLEHVWHHENSFKNLKNLLAPEGLLWLATPAANRAHGSPDYFSAGFTSTYLSRNLRCIELEILESGQLGSRRNFIALHLMPTWLSIKAHNIPILYAFAEYAPMKRVILRIRYSHWLLILHLFSRKITDDIQVATESWVLARRSTKGVE